MPLVVSVLFVPYTAETPRFATVAISNLTTVRVKAGVDVSSRIVAEKVAKVSVEVTQLVLLLTRNRLFFPRALSKYWISTASGAPPLRVTSILVSCVAVVPETIDGVPTKKLWV